MKPRGAGLALVFFQLGLAAAAAPAYDLVIRNGTVVDGTGQYRYRADIGIIGDTIAAVGRLDAPDLAARTIDATGLIVTPGFIDLHGHLADTKGVDNPLVGPGLFSPDVRYRAAQNYVTQGITTAVINPDGMQFVPLAQQRAEFTRLGIGLNVALMTGHMGLRPAVLGNDQNRPATPEEITRMQALLLRDLEENGSFGLSLGLEYSSGRYASTTELVGLAKTLAAHNGLYHAHQRSQGSAPMWYQPSVDVGVKPPTLSEALDESLAVAEQTGVKILITHMKGWGPGYRGHAAEYVARIDAAHARGLRIYIDSYSYVSAGSDGDFVPLPAWAVGKDKMPWNDPRDTFDYVTALKQTLTKDDARSRLERDIANSVALKGGAENIHVLEYPDSTYVGQTLAQLMAKRLLGLTDLIIALQLEGSPHKAGGAKLRAVSMDERDVMTYFAQPWCAVGTDGRIVLPEDAQGIAKFLGTNQRFFGTFPRRLAYFSGVLKIDSFEEAVRKCSSLPAGILGLLDRGRIAPGMKADIAVIDLANLRDNTTLMEPSVYATGLRYVLVNGQAVIDGDRRTLALPGRVLDPTKPRR